MSTHPRVVLIADDSHDQRAIIAREVRDLAPDAEVIEAADGYAALRLATERGDVTLAILDYVMPGMTGAQVARILGARGIVCHVVTSSPISDEAARTSWPKDRVISLLPVWLGIEHPKVRAARRDEWPSNSVAEVRRMLSSRSFATA